MGHVGDEMVKIARGGRVSVFRANRKEDSRTSPFCLVAVERLKRECSPSLAARGRQLVLAGSALAFGFVFSLSAAQKAIAGCVDDASNPNTVLCNAARVTTDTTYDVTAGGTSANRADREQLFTANGN